MSDPERRPKRYGLPVAAYALEFKHEDGTWPIKLTLRGRTRMDGTFVPGGSKREVEIIRKRRTMALLVNPVDGAAVFAGEAYCSPFDGYDFEVGRQTALFDLLRALPKERGKVKVHLGRQVMAAYLTRPGALPWALDRQGKLRPWVLAAARAARRASAGDVLARVHALAEMVTEALVDHDAATPA